MVVLVQPFCEMVGRRRRKLSIIHLSGLQPAGEAVLALLIRMNRAGRRIDLAGDQWPRVIGLGGRELSKLVAEG